MNRLSSALLPLTPLSGVGLKSGIIPGRSIRAVRRRILIPCYLLLILVSTTNAQKILLTAEAHSESFKLRTYGPISLAWTLNYHGDSLLEGRLRMSLRDGNHLSWSCRSHDMVLNTGQQVVRTTLPSWGSDPTLVEANIHLEFETRDAVIDLGEHFLTGNLSQRLFNVCICDAMRTARNQIRDRLASKLRIEAIGTETSEDFEPPNRSVITLVTEVSSESLPENPLGYCSFDIVVLTPSGFEGLRERQITGLRHWVRAGGSLCVVAAGMLEPYHVDLLNDVMASREQRVFGFDVDGRLFVDSPQNHGGLWLTRHELGRVAITTSKNLEDPSWDQWRTLVPFLWKTNSSQLMSVQRTGQWDEDLLQKDLKERLLRQRYTSGRNYIQTVSQPGRFLAQFVPVGGVEQLIRKLMPDDVSVVPLWIIALVLILYVLLIGPVDYFVLGWLHMRRLTWITFPTVTVAVGLFFVWLSNYYLNSASTSKSITFVDVGTDGGTLRESTFELLFLSKHRNYETEVRQAIFAPMNHQQFLGEEWMWRMDPYYYQNRGTRPIVGAATYEGSIPTRYVARQAVPQWTPQLNRRFTIAPDEVLSEPVIFEWGGWQEISTPEGRQRLSGRIDGTFGKDATSYWYQSDAWTKLHGSPQLLFADPRQYGARHYREGTEDVFLHEVCVRPQVGLFAAVSQISPTGGDNFEDLSILDPTDKNQILLVIMVRKENDLVVYRRLYTGTEK